MAASFVSDSGRESTRRSRVACRTCGTLIEIGKLREHLRNEHRVDSSALEAELLSATMGVRRSRRARS